MAVIRPFRALRPVPAVASAVAAVPYDVVSTKEARALAAGNPLSFLHVSRAEIGLPAHADPYGDNVYQRAATNLKTLRQTAPFVIEDRSSLYLYRLRVGDHEQTGLTGCFSLDEYDRNVIKRHEWTRRDKEDDRTRHVLALGAQTGIVFVIYRGTSELTDLTRRASLRGPLFNFSAPDGVQHTIWQLSQSDQTAVVAAFEQLPALYIADGHHRIASAARACKELTPATGDDLDAEARVFLGVAFPDTETKILAYNRTVANLDGLTPHGLVEAIGARFPLRRGANPTPSKGYVAMYLEGTWYEINMNARTQGADKSQASRLDVAVLQDQLLAPVLQVADVRTDPRLTFVGGVRGVEALEQIVDSGKAVVAFSLAPVTPAELLAIADAGEIMPPKSTWFEPKLRDGLLIHLI